MTGLRADFLGDPDFSDIEANKDEHTVWQPGKLLKRTGEGG